MSQYYKQMQHGGRDAKRMLQERLQREEIGDAAYDKAASHTDERGFRIFGVIFIALFAAVVLVVTWLDY